MTDPATSSSPDKAVALRLDLDVEDTKVEVAVVEPKVSDELQERAVAVSEKLLSFDPDDQDSRVVSLDAVEGMGRNLQRRTGLGAHRAHGWHDK